MRECRGRRWVGQVIRGNVDRLHRGDGTAFRRSDPLLQLAHLRRQIRLIADGAGHAAQQRGDFRSRLRETKNVVDEEKHILSLRVTEVLGDSEAGEADAQSGTGRFSHLTIDERRFGLGWIAGNNHAAFGELQPEVIPLACSLPDAGENGEAAVLFGHVVDELLNQNGLADSGTPEETRLTSLGVRFQEIDDFDAGLENLDFRRLLFKWRRLAMDGPPL